MKQLSLIDSLDIEVINKQYNDTLARYNELIKTKDNVFLVKASNGQYYTFTSTERQIKINKLTVIKNN